MKKLLCIFSFALIFNAGNAQDVIIKRSGDEIQSKVLEITSTEIKYKNFDHLDGPMRSVLKADVFMIKYENGTKELFEEEGSATNENAENEPVKEQDAEVIKENEIDEQKTTIFNTEPEQKIKKQLPDSIKDSGVKKGYIGVNFLTLYHKYRVPFVGAGIGINLEFPIKLVNPKRCMIVGAGFDYIQITSTKSYPVECPDCYDIDYGYTYSTQDTTYGKTYTHFAYMDKLIAELYIGARRKFKKLEYSVRLGPTFVRTYGKGPGDGIPDPDRVNKWGSHDFGRDWSGYNTLGIKYGLQAKLPFFKNHGYGFVLGFDQMFSFNGALMYYLSIGLTFI